FNVTFEDAVRRRAQIAYDLQFPGTPIRYSWPSQGTAVPFGCTTDGALRVLYRKNSRAQLYSMFAFAFLVSCPNLSPCISRRVFRRFSRSSRPCSVRH